MKKFLTALLFFTVLSGCSTKRIEINPQQLIGVWGCETIYQDLYAATKDIVDIRNDGTVKMIGLIYDHHFNWLIGKNIENYFHAPLLYSTEAQGTWRLNGDRLTYTLTQQFVKRAIYPKIMKKIQVQPSLKEFEQAIFNVYAGRNHSNKNEKIKLIITQIIADNFSAKQVLSDSSYLSACHRLVNKEQEIKFILGIEKVIF